MSKVRYRFVESELYNYKNNVETMKELEDDIINASAAPSSDRVTSSTISDTTADKASRLHSSAEIMYLKRNIAAIEKALTVIKAMPEWRKYRLIEMKYFKAEFTDKKIASDLFISIETYYRWKRECIYLIGEFMGIKI